MSGPTIVLVGGGSAGWSPGVLGSLLAQPRLQGADLVLHDLDAAAAARMQQVAVRLAAAAGVAATCRVVADVDAALEGADYVVVTISTGGLEAMAVDLEVPEAFGIYQTVGDTVGPGGLSRTLRNVPVFLDLARRMERRCPEAWMLNASNPLSGLTRIVHRETSIRALGLCHGVRGAARSFAQAFGVPLADCAYVNSGIDHCAWFTQFQVEGENAWERLGRMGLDAWLAATPAEAKADAALGGLYSLRCGLRLGRRLGALPAINDRHMVEFFAGFLNDLEAIEGQGLVRTSIADRRANAERAATRVAQLAAGEVEPELSAGSDDVGAWIVALDGGAPTEDNLNAPNLGQIPQLPADAVVETRGVLDATGYRPLAAPLPPALEAVVRPHVLRQELAVEAALTGSVDTALAALTSDPLLRRPDDARPLLEALIAGTRAWLPQFGGRDA